MIFFGRCDVCDEMAMLSNTDFKLSEARCALCAEEVMRTRDLMGGFVITSRGA